MRVCFYAAVFSLFASVGALASFMDTAYVSPLHIASNIAVVGGFAMVYAAASLWRRYWLIPIAAIAEGVFFGIIGAHYLSLIHI